MSLALIHGLISHCSNDSALTQQPAGRTTSMHTFLPTTQYIYLADDGGATSEHTRLNVKHEHNQ